MIEIDDLWCEPVANVGYSRSRSADATIVRRTMIIVRAIELAAAPFDQFETGGAGSGELERIVLFVCL